MAESGFRCELCDVFFHKLKEYTSHCEGRKHKVQELLAHEHDVANRRLFVRGIDQLHDPQTVLHSHFSGYGRLNNISFGGKEGSLYAVVEFQDLESITRAMNVKHRIQRCVLYVRRYKYQPQYWERNKLTSEAFQKDERTRQAQAKDEMLKVLLTADSLMDQISLVAENLKLDPAERKARVQICEELTELFAPHFENSRVYQFGSSVNGFGAKGCDLDLFLDIDDENASNDKSKIRKLSQILSRSPHFDKTMTIPSNRCPVVRFLHKSSNIKCDLSINNRKALHNSYLLRLFSTDHRVHKLVSIVRLWAKSQGLTGTFGGAHLFTSYAITLIVLYFLMHRKPQMIPLVCDIEKCVEGTCKEVVGNTECLCIPAEAELPPSDNKDNEVDLVKEFFAFYSESVNWETDALFMKDATVFPRSQISQDPNFIGCKAGRMTVIDPFVLSHNVVANINEWTKTKFITELKRAAELTRDWPVSVQKLESGPWGVAELLIANSDQTAGKSRKKSHQQPAVTANNGQEKSPDVAGNMNLASKSNITLVEGEQENGEFCITLQPVSQSLKCAQLLLTAKKNNVTPAEQWCNMAQELILNVLKTVFVVEVEEVSLLEEERKGKPGQDVVLSRGPEVKPQNDSEMKDEAGGCKRSSDAAHLDGAIAESIPETDVPLDGEVGNPKKFCEGITTSLDKFEEVIVKASADSCMCKPEGDDSSNACSGGKSSDDDCCMEIANEQKIELENQNASSVPRSNRQQETGDPCVSIIAEASSEATPKDPSSEVQIPSTSSGVTEVRTSKVFSYACKCRHQVWIDRKKMYHQLPQKHGLSSLALEQKVTKLVLARKDAFLQKINAADQGEVESPKNDNELNRSPPSKATKKSLVKDADVKETKIDPEKLPAKQDIVSASQTEKSAETSKKTWPPEVEFSCEIVYQNCDVDLKLPHILMKLKPSSSCSKPFKNFFSAFRSQILRLITQHFFDILS